MLGYLFPDIIGSEKRIRSQKTVSYEEQMMSKAKYPSIFIAPNRGYCIYYSQILFAMRQRAVFKNWEIFNNYPAKSRGISSDT